MGLTLTDSRTPARQVCAARERGLQAPSLELGAPAGGVRLAEDRLGVGAVREPRQRLDRDDGAGRDRDDGLHRDPDVRGPHRYRINGLRPRVDGTGQSPGHAHARPAFRRRLRGPAQSCLCVECEARWHCCRVRRHRPALGWRVRGGSSAGQSSGLIIRPSWVQAPPAPPVSPAGAGSTIVKVDPSPGTDAISRVPPCRSAIVLVIARPRPVPPTARRWASVPR